MKLISAGRNDDYTKHDGFSHDAADDRKFISMFDNVDGYWPDTVAELHSVINKAIDTPTPCYINIKR